MKTFIVDLESLKERYTDTSDPVTHVYYNYIYATIEHSSAFCYENFKLFHKPFYVGKGKNKRFLPSTKLLDNINPKLTQTIKEMGDNIIVYLSNSFYGEAQALKIEKDLIKTIGRKDKNTGPLLNMTDGGQSPIGLKNSEESNKKRSQTLMGHFALKGKDSPSFGRLWPEEAKQRMSIIKTLKPTNYWLGKHRSTDTKEKLSKAFKGRILTKEHRRKISETMKKRGLCPQKWTKK